MATLELKVLGELTITQNGIPLPEIKSQKGKALLCYLAVRGKTATRPFLAALFWPDMPERQALMNLRKTLQRLRPLHSYLLITRETVAFNNDADFWLDVAEFEEGAILQDSARLQEAVALYQGDFLDGFMLSNTPLFEEWVLGQRARLREAALGTLRGLIVHFEEGGELETAVAYARQLLTIEPWHEETHRDLMRLLALSNKRSAALAQYETCCQMLADELGVAPATATVQLYEQIKAGELDRGAKGQGSREDGAPPHNLPLQLTPFVGREAELVQLQNLLAQPDVRLITILGAGGMGKTRLALALANQILSNQDGHKEHPYRHGVYFASLARLETADLLLPAIAEAINFHFAEGNNQAEQLLRYLANKAMLLVLDNFEHLLTGTSLVDEVLQAAPRLKIVITTRMRLNRQMEQLFPMGGMAYPPENGKNASKLSEYSAVRLFLQCARRVRPGFDLTDDNQAYVLQICQLLQGMPLGIVLAASWLDSLSPRAISREMQQDIDFLATDMADVPRRQSSLRAAFNHSWRLLNVREQEIYCQMSIFRGGFSRAAAQTITGATLRDLQALVNKSLLTLSPDRRYDVHELLRQFAAEKLSERLELETAVRQHHSAHYCNLLQQHTANWHNAHQLEALAEVTHEANNIQVAWSWALGHEAWSRLDGAIDSWCWYHQWRGLRHDGEALCQAISTNLEQWATNKPADAAAGYRLWAKTLAWSGKFTLAILDGVQKFEQCLVLLASPQLANDDTRSIEAFALLGLGDRLPSYDRQEAYSYLEKSLHLYEALQDSWGIATSLSDLGHVDWSLGDYALAQQRAEASLPIHQKQGDQWAEADLLNIMGWLYQHLGKLAKAEQFRHNALDLFQRLDNRRSLAQAMANMSFTVSFQGKFDEGYEWGKKSLQLSLENGYLGSEGFARLAISTAHLHAGHYTLVQQELITSLTLAQATNDHGQEASIHCYLGYLTLVGENYDDAHAAFTEGHRLYQSTQGDAYIFLALSGLIFSNSYRGDLAQAHHYCLELLTEGLKRKDFLWMCQGLPAIALYLAKRGKREQAVRVWARAKCQPFVANSQFFEAVVGQVVAGATADLPLEVVEAAQENGRSQTIWHMAESLLADLQSEG